MADAPVPPPDRTGAPDDAVTVTLTSDVIVPRTATQPPLIVLPNPQ